MAKKKKKQNNKIIRYRRPLNINIGMIIFALIFVYMSLSVYTYIRREKIQFYEVVDGGIVNDRSYTGLVLRDEEVKYTDRAGTIDYYVREANGRQSAQRCTLLMKKIKWQVIWQKTTMGKSLVPTVSLL